MGEKNNDDNAWAKLAKEAIDRQKLLRLDDEFFRKMAEEAVRMGCEIDRETIHYPNGRPESDVGKTSTNTVKAGDGK